MFKLVLEKAEEPEIKLPTSIGSSKRQESSRKTSNTALLNTKAFDCVDYNKLWKILKEMGVPDHLTCLLRNLYVGQEATVKTRLTTYSLVMLLFLFGTSLLFHVQFSLLIPDLHTDFSGGRSGGLVSTSLEEFFSLL